MNPEPDHSLSSRLLASHMAAQSPRRPFGQPPNISTQGPMSFDSQMHATNNASGASTPTLFDSSFMDMTEDSAKKIAALQAKLDKRLGPEYISQRPGPGGGPKLTYVEGWRVINLANEVFGFNGWSSNIVSITTDFIDYSEENRRYSVGVTAIVRVTLRDGVFHEDVGYGLLENTKSKGAALDKCKKEAVTDAVKRTLRNFGNMLGNCLYDKSYTQEVVKIKVPPPKFDRGDLHRRPEFEESKPDSSTMGSASGDNTLSHIPITGPSIIKPEPLTCMPPPSHIPQRHPTPNAMSTPNAKGKTPLGSTGQGRPIHAHTQQNVVGMAQKTADRHAARLKAIQEAQEAHRREQETVQAAAAATAAAASSSTSATSVAGSGSSTASPPQVAAPAAPPKKAIADDDDDEYFKDDDSDFLANLNFDALDEGLGRPIDFDEGRSAATETDEDDVVMHSTGASNGQSVLPPQLLQQQKTNSGPTGTSNLTSRPQTSHPHKPQNQNIPPVRQVPNDSSSNSERPRTPSMGGGFSYPKGQPLVNPGSSTSRAQPQSHNPPRGSLKRTADIMQGIAAGLASRRPQQGMGLQNPPSATNGTQTVATGSKREPLASLELGEGRDVKRARRQ